MTKATFAQILLISAVAVGALGDREGAAVNEQSSFHLRGHTPYTSSTTVTLHDADINLDHGAPSRSLQEDEEDGILMLSQHFSFQIVMSVVLGIIVSAQLVLLGTYVIHRSKRVLEFAQPAVICVFVAAGVIATSVCYLYIYISNVGCALREPILFIALSFMGATITSRAWRISTLMKNPLTAMINPDDVPRVERARQKLLLVLTALSGCDFSVLNMRASSRGGRPLRVEVSIAQLMKVTLLLVLPQLLFQIAMMGIPALRSYKDISYYEDFGGSGLIIGQYTCQSSAAGSWPIYLSVLFVLLPFGCAYLLNIRQRTELEQLPEIIDERDQLNSAFAACIRVLVITVPIIVLTLHSPSARAYAIVCAALGLPLSLCYYIAYLKLKTTKSSKSNGTQQRQSTRRGWPTGGSTSPSGDEGNAQHTVRLAEMYEKIGRVKETVELVDETLSTWKRGNSTSVIANLTNNEGREEVGAGFTKNELKDLDSDELTMIVRLIRIKGNALMKIHGGPGFAMSAKLNIDALRIFEHCPAKMKDVSIMFPIYNMVGLQLKGGIIEQDDECSLESDLARQYCLEAQTQAYHYARALANLAEWYGRIGDHEKAFKHFEIMRAVYIPEYHRERLMKAYSVDRCAVSFAVSALWYLQKGDSEKAIERCDYVINEILPSYDKKDIVGLFSILAALIRVLKWNGQVDKVRKVYNDNTPEGTEKHFAVGSLHKPICLLLRICDGSSEEYNTDNMADDIELALSCTVPDMTDNNMTCDCGWSMNSIVTELCFHLARRLEPGDATRLTLINRGIEMAIVAYNRVLASNGLIKHVLAYEAHKEIHKKLLALASNDVGISRSVIYADDDQGVGKQLKRQPGALHCSIIDTKSDFASRLAVKDDVSTNNSKGSGSKTSSAPTHISIAKKKVEFTSKISSSFRSNGSTSKHSNQSYESHGSQASASNNSKPEISLKGSTSKHSTKSESSLDKDRVGIIPAIHNNSRQKDEEEQHGIITINQQHKGVLERQLDDTSTVLDEALESFRELE